MRHTADYIRRRLLSRSVVDLQSPLVEGCHCRMWQRAKRGGYGRLWDGERLVDAHRLAHEVFKGPIPEGLDALHHCDRPGCIEGAHLWAGTHQANMADRHAKGRTRNGGELLRGRPSKTRGAKHEKAKLTERQALAIKRAPRVTGSRQALAAKYGVSVHLIDGIRSGNNWGWLDI